MDTPRVLCLDDQAVVLHALRNDLEEIGNTFGLVQCESATEAAEVMDELDADGIPVGVVICDHVMPDKSGIDFLIEVAQDRRFAHTRKVLLTGLASHQDTIKAINRAGLDSYIEKPWDAAELTRTVRRLLSQYVVHAGIDHEPLLDALDQEVLYEELRKRV